MKDIEKIVKRTLVGGLVAGAVIVGVGEYIDNNKTTYGGYAILFATCITAIVARRE